MAPALVLLLLPTALSSMRSPSSLLMAASCGVSARPVALPLEPFGWGLLCSSAALLIHALSFLAHSLSFHLKVLSLRSFPSTRSHADPFWQVLGLGLGLGSGSGP